MKRLQEYIFEQINYNEKGFSNYFQNAEDFIDAVKENNEIMKNIFKEPYLNESKLLYKTIEFINNIYDEAGYNDYKFEDCPLIFNINGKVKLKRKYQNSKELRYFYDNFNGLKYKYLIGNGSRNGTTKGNEYEDTFVSESKEYITYLINGTQLTMNKQQIELFENLFDTIKVNNTKLSTYININKLNINPDNFVKLTRGNDTKRNKNNLYVDNTSDTFDIKLNNLSESGKIIADVKYILLNGDVINISLKDKDYQLSNLGMGKKSLNIYPIFSEDYTSDNNKRFASFCDYIGIDIKKVFNKLNDSENTNEIIDNKDGKIYNNICNLFKLAIGSNYYMVNSNGDIHYIPDMTSHNIKIEKAIVGYPSSRRKRVNIDIEFNKSTENIIGIGSIQMAIRSKTGSKENAGFKGCQLVWGKIKPKKYLT